MVSNAILSISVLLQLAAALLSLRLIKETGKHFPWVLLAIALTLMASRRIITLTDILLGDGATPINLAAEMVALVISVLMISAVLAVKPVLRAVRLSAIQIQEEKYRAAEEAHQKDIVLDSIFQAIPDLFFWWTGAAPYSSIGSGRILTCMYSRKPFSASACGMCCQNR